MSVEDDPLPAREYQQPEPGPDPAGRPQLHEGFPEREAEAAEDGRSSPDPEDPLPHALQAHRGQGNQRSQTRGETCYSCRCRFGHS